MTIKQACNLQRQELNEFSLCSCSKKNHPAHEVKGELINVWAYDHESYFEQICRIGIIISAEEGEAIELGI